MGYEIIEIEKSQNGFKYHVNFKKQGLVAFDFPVDLHKDDVLLKLDSLDVDLQNSKTQDESFLPDEIKELVGYVKD